MKKFVLLFCITPIIILLEIIFIGQIFSLVSNASDISVFVGVALLSLFLFINCLLFYFIYKKIKK